MNNINNSDNISYTTKAKNFIDSIPFCIKILLGSNLILFCFCRFFIPFSFALANIPYYTILRFQIWRLVTSNFISTSFLNLIFVFFFWLPQSMNLERSIGTVRYMINFFINSFFIQLLYDLFLLIFYIFKSSILLKKIYYDKNNNMEYIESDGLWPYIMMEMTILCLVNPEKDINVLCIFSSIKSKYYPIVLLVVLSFINFSIRLDLFAGVAYGFIYSYYLKNFLDFNEQTIEKLEGSFLFNYVKDYPSFIKKSNIDASLLLGSNMNNDNNYNNYNNYNNNLNNNILRFTPFTGNSVQVGGN